MLTWVVFVHYFDVSFMVEDVVKRPFITVGMTVFVILFALALTSNRFAIRKLGTPLAVAAPARLRGGDRRRDPLLVAGEGRHHRAARAGPLGLAVLLGLRAWWAYRKRMAAALVAARRAPAARS